uniref:HTH myb-type domain-containing protein n=1 Tax=Trieres chinensis TaxID=1514140 RepID=A0A7S2EYC9_TRICV
MTLARIATQPTSKARRVPPLSKYLMKDGIKSGRWDPAECKRFGSAIRIFGEGDWKSISVHVKTRTPNQCKSHNQKLKKKEATEANLQKNLCEIRWQKGFIGQEHTNDTSACILNTKSKIQEVKSEEDRRDWENKWIASNRIRFIIHHPEWSSDELQIARDLCYRAKEQNSCGAKENPSQPE